MSYDRVKFLGLVNSVGNEVFRKYCSFKCNGDLVKFLSSSQIRAQIKDDRDAKIIHKYQFENLMSKSVDDFDISISFYIVRNLIYGNSDFLRIIGNNRDSAHMELKLLEKVKDWRNSELIGHTIDFDFSPIQDSAYEKLKGQLKHLGGIIRDKEGVQRQIAAFEADYENYRSQYADKLLKELDDAIYQDLIGLLGKAELEFSTNDELKREIQDCKKLLEDKASRENLNSVKENMDLTKRVFNKLRSINKQMIDKLVLDTIKIDQDTGVNLSTFQKQVNEQHEWTKAQLALLTAEIQRLELLISQNKGSKPKQNTENKKRSIFCCFAA